MLLRLDLVLEPYRVWENPRMQASVGMSCVSRARAGDTPEENIRHQLLPTVWLENVADSIMCVNRQASMSLSTACAVQ